jgi:hypothetical protein
MGGGESDRGANDPSILFLPKIFFSLLSGKGEMKKIRVRVEEVFVY